MSGRLSNAASRLFGGGGIIAQSVTFSLTRSGMGLPVGKHIVPDNPLPEQDELVWDNGTPYPEPCIDRLAPTIGKYEALAWLCGGLGFFASIGLLAVWNNKASKIPFIRLCLTFMTIIGGVVVLFFSQLLSLQRSLNESTKKFL